MTLLPIVRELIESNAVHKGLVEPAGDMRWLDGVPALKDTTTFRLHHNCDTTARVVPVVQMKLTAFLMDMKPQAAVMVFVGQCRHCRIAFFAEHDDGDDEEGTAEPPRQRHPKGPRQR